MATVVADHLLFLDTIYFVNEGFLFILVLLVFPRLPDALQLSRVFDGFLERGVFRFELIPSYVVVFYSGDEDI